MIASAFLPPFYWFVRPAMPFHNKDKICHYERYKLHIFYKNFTTSIMGFTNTKFKIKSLTQITASHGMDK